MSDNVPITPGAGTTISTDDIGNGVQVQRVKVQHGADGSATDASSSAPLPVTLANTGLNSTAVAVQGGVAAGSADSGNPVKAGGVYSTTPPTLTDGQRGNFQIGTRGSLAVQLTLPDSASNPSFVATNADAVAASAIATRFDTAAKNYVFNGATWDRSPGSTTGNYSVVRDAAGNARGANVNSSNQLSVSVDNFLGQVTVSTDVTRPADTNALAANDAWSDSTSAPTSGGFTFASAARASGGSGIITDAIITTSADAATLLQGEIWIFDSAVTNVNDNSAFAVSDSEIKTMVGKIPFVLEDAGNNGSASVLGLNIGFTCVGSANLRFLVRVKNAYTPVSAEVLTVRLKILQTT